MKNLIAVLMMLVAFTVRLSAGEAPGETGFLLGGTAQNAQDPQNPANDVIKIDTTSPPSCDPPNYINCAFGSVSAEAQRENRGAQEYGGGQSVL